MKLKLTDNQWFYLKIAGWVLFILSLIAYDMIS